MTRDELQVAAARRLYQDKRLICQWPTGCGKTNVALQFLKYNPGTALILVPEKDNIKNWYAEFEKFDISTLGVEIACYASIHKYEGTSWSVIVIDEAPHANTELKSMYFSTIKADYVLALGAYLREEEKEALENLYGRFTVWTISLKQAIDAGFIPHPTVCIIHMQLDNTERKYHTKRGAVTALEYYSRIDNQVKDAVAMYNSSATEWAKVTMKRLGAERKRVLGMLKEDSVAKVCEALRKKNKRHHRLRSRRRFWIGSTTTRSTSFMWLASSSKGKTSTTSNAASLAVSERPIESRFNPSDAFFVVRILSSMCPSLITLKTRAFFIP